MRLVFVVVALLIVSDATVSAGPPRRSRLRQSEYVTQPAVTSQEQLVNEIRQVESSVESKSDSKTTTLTGSDDALDEVNAERAKRGLKPFLPDPLLNKAALACAKQRCARFIHGHLPESDFSYLPAGGQATSAGCGALEPSWGWGTCCTYDNYTYAGAAWVMGSDGRRYMHLFVR